MGQGSLILAAGRVRSKKNVKIGKKHNRKNSAPPKTHHEIHSSSATATTSRRRATKNVPRTSPCSPAPTDPGFVKIGFVQLSQSVKTTNVTHTQTHIDRQTDRQTNVILASLPRYEEAFMPKGPKRPHYEDYAQYEVPAVLYYLVYMLNALELRLRLIIL